MKNTKIGLGLAAVGRPEYINIRSGDDINKSEKAFKRNAFELMDLAYNKGIVHFDTAPSYGKGEDFLIEWYQLNAYKNLKLSTKWGYTYVANWQIGYPEKHEVKEHTLQKLLEQWKTSKKLLPALKIYQIHSATFESGILENSEVLQQLNQIKIKTGIKIGLTTSGSNQSDVLETADQIEINNVPLFDSYQVSYNILDQSSHDVLQQIIKNGKTVIVKEALANGRLLQNETYPHYSLIYKYLEELSKKYQVGFDGIALRFIMDSLAPEIVLSGASNIIQLKENLKAMNFRLENKELISLKNYAVNSNFYWNEREKLQWN